MKRSTMRMALAGTMVSLVCFGGQTGAANAQGASTVAIPSLNSEALGTALTYGAAQVGKMYQSGVSKDAILAYINNSTYPCELNADGVLYLHRLGVPEDITQAMIRRDGELRQQGVAVGAKPVPDGQVSPSTVMPQSTVVTPATPAPQVTRVGSDYPDYYYGYPYYGYDYWPLYVGGGWGWGGWGWNHGWGNRGGWGYHGGFHGGGFHGGGFHGRGSHGGGGGHR